MKYPSQDSNLDHPNQGGTCPHLQASPSPKLGRLYRNFEQNDFKVLGHFSPTTLRGFEPLRSPLGQRGALSL